MDAKIIPASEYHAKSSVSRSQLDDFRESPYGYYMRHVVKDPEWQLSPTKDMQDGTLLHSLVLEHSHLIWEQPQVFGDLAIYPAEVLNKNGDRGTKACKEWEAENSSKILRKSDELGEIWQWARMLTKSKGWDYLNHPSRSVEHTIEFSHWNNDGTQIDLRSRLDLVIPGERIVDLKKCARGDINDIENVIAKCGYDFQAGFYTMAWRSVSGETLPFTFVFQESQKPYRTSTWTMDPRWVEEAEHEVLDTIDDLKRTADIGRWNNPLSEVEMTAYKPKWVNYRYKKVSQQ